MPPSHQECCRLDTFGCGHHLHIRRLLFGIEGGVGQQRVARGSSPASRAICALVRRLGLNGGWVSSTACLVAACFDERATSSSVQFAPLFNRRSRIVAAAL